MAMQSKWEVIPYLTSNLHSVLSSKSDRKEESSLRTPILDSVTFNRFSVCHWAKCDHKQSQDLPSNDLTNNAVK